MNLQLTGKTALITGG